MRALEDHVRIHIKVQAGEFEIEGPVEIVSKYEEQVRALLGFATKQGSSMAKTNVEQATEDETESPVEIIEDIPETFGEFFSRFPKKMQDVDNVLVAAHFAQSNNQDKQFKTKEVNKLLQVQGIKVTNASRCVTLNINKKYIFATQKGNFRISRSGEEHVKALQNS